jgi:hypothetical protein
MYTRKLAIFAILAGTGLVLVTTFSLAIGSVLAVKTGSTHSSGIDNRASTANTNITTATLDTSSKDLNNLFACESTASKGRGGLTQDGLMNCYTHTFTSNSAVPAVAGAPDFGSSNGANTTHDNGSSGHNHHHSSGKSSSSPSAAALSGLG